jgi:hypothetical protein
MLLKTLRMKYIINIEVHSVGCCTLHISPILARGTAWASCCFVVCRAWSIRCSVAVFTGARNGALAICRFVVWNKLTLPNVWTEEMRALIRFSWAQNGESINIHTQIVVVCGANAMRCHDFANEPTRTEISVQEHGTSSSQTSPKWRKLADVRCLTKSELSFRLSHGGVWDIVHEYGFRTPKQLCDRMTNYEPDSDVVTHRLCCWRMGAELQSGNEGEIHDNRREVMATVFGDMYGIVLVDCLPRGTSVTAGAHEATLQRRKEALRRRRPVLLTTRCASAAR